MQLLFPDLSSDVLYLLGKEAEPEGYECGACCCPLCTFYLETPRRLRWRCASCGAKADGWIAADDSWLSRVAAHDRRDRAIDEYEREFGRWWFDMWFCAPRGH